MTPEPLTESAFISMVSELFDRSKESALKTAHDLWNSGAIDTGSYENNYALPKLFMVAYSDRIKDDWSRPVGYGHKEKADLRNMKHFV